MCVKKGALATVFNLSQLSRNFIKLKNSRGPTHIIILMTGGSDRGSYFIPQKIPTSEVVYPKKSLVLLAYPKKSLSVFASANFIIYLLER